MTAIIPLVLAIMVSFGVGVSYAAENFNSEDEANTYSQELSEEISEISEDLNLGRQIASAAANDLSRAAASTDEDDCIVFLPGDANPTLGRPGTGTNGSDDDDDDDDDTPTLPRPGDDDDDDTDDDDDNGGMLQRITRIVTNITGSFNRSIADSFNRTVTITSTDNSQDNSVDIYEDNDIEDNDTTIDRRSWRWWIDNSQDNDDNSQDNDDNSQDNDDNSQDNDDNSQDNDDNSSDDDDECDDECPDDDDECDHVCHCDHECPDDDDYEGPSNPYDNYDDDYNGYWPSSTPSVILPTPSADDDDDDDGGGFVPGYTPQPIDIDDIYLPKSSTLPTTLQKVGTYPTRDLIRPYADSTNLRR